MATLGALALALGGCSLVLDPDDLTAELLVTRDGQDATALDTTTLDTTTPDDTTLDDTASPLDTAPGDTADTTTTDTNAATDADTPDTPASELVLRWSGQPPGTCTLAFRKNLTNCPVSCPDGKGWTIVVDASESTGIGAFQWRFGATDGYGVSPRQAVGPRVTLTVTEPDCALLAGADMSPGSIAVELATDGGGFVPLSPIRWSIQYISGLSCSSPGDCPAP